MEENFVSGEERGRVREMITEGEELLWCGKRRVRFLSGSSLFFIPFGMVYSSVPAIGLGMMFYSKQECSLLLIIIAWIFLMIGLALVIIPPIVRYRSLRRWIYALTNKRAIIIQNDGVFEYPLEPQMAQVMELLHRLLDGEVIENKEIEEERECLRLASQFSSLVVFHIVLGAVAVKCAMSIILCDGEDSILLPAMGFVGVSMVIRCTFKSLRMAARGRKLKKDGQAEMPKNPLK